MLYSMYRKVSETLELGHYIETTGALSDLDLARIWWLIRETYDPEQTTRKPQFRQNHVVEIGPRLSIETPFSSSAVAICESVGIPQIVRLEQTRRIVRNESAVEMILKEHLDRMTEAYYPKGIEKFDLGIVPQEVRVIEVFGKGKAILEEENKSLGLGMDASDIDYYFHLFSNVLGRNPTDVELFQLGNANSEHSRHWFFVRGRMVIDDVPMPNTLFEIVRRPLEHLGQNNSSIIAFRDNGGVLEGSNTMMLIPAEPGKPSRMVLVRKLVHHTASAETHNHPSYIEPFNGGGTGFGGWLRDIHAIGKGSYVGTASAGYAVGNLLLPGYKIPGEVTGIGKNSKYASSAQILVRSSDGVSSYGNQAGVPLTHGFCRTFEQVVDGEWLAWRKPIVYVGGTGHIFDEHTEKEAPQIGMIIVRTGGPAYPVGVGGGSASSMTQGENSEALDFNSVQRGNAEVENRANRVIRTCVEMGPENPISSIHDQGAGGPSNVITELTEPLGGTVDIRCITLGDKTMSVLQIWSAEFQEGYGFLIKEDKINVFIDICLRESVSYEILGTIDGSGKIVVYDSSNNTTPVDLDLKKVLTDLPMKTFPSTRKKRGLKSLELGGISVGDAIRKVFQLPSVGSKGFLVHKADRSVGGLVAQQQDCGIAQIPIADVSINAQNYFDITGTATAIGEQPIKMLVNTEAGARMAVGEMLTNLSSAVIRNLGEVRCRANWMWPAKLPHEGARIYDAAIAMSDLMMDLGIAVDGGKDSSSMMAVIEDETVKAPGNLVIYGYAPMEDIRQKVTPDIKRPNSSLLYLIDLGKGKNRLGGSALAQTLNQIGDESPDMDDPQLFRNAFLAIQRMIKEGLLLSMHDRSDGGLITTITEMCMASRCGFELYVGSQETAIPELFNEELGWVVEVDSEHAERVSEICRLMDIEKRLIGLTHSYPQCSIRARTTQEELFSSTIMEMRSWWEETSSELDKFNLDPSCVSEESVWQVAHSISVNQADSYKLSFTPRTTPSEFIGASGNPRVAVLREKGTNGDREMIAAFYAAGLDPWDVSMSDLSLGKVSLDDFQGLADPGGFSYMDVMGSGKGWAATILFNEKLKKMFDRFYARKDTFSLGVCNGCQLMALIGWIPWRDIDPEKQPRFIHNKSGRFESRWVQVQILESPAILFDGMTGSKLGVWVAHGEGQVYFPDRKIMQEVERLKLAPLAYLNPQGDITERYPYNPNGSPVGMTALCSPDGRHLAMMPHPERSFLPWQCSWMPKAWRDREVSPWLRMFQNARKWCLEHRS